MDAAGEVEPTAERAAEPLITSGFTDGGGPAPEGHLFVEFTFRGMWEGREQRTLDVPAFAVVNGAGAGPGLSTNGVGVGLGAFVFLGDAPRAMLYESRSDATGTALTGKAVIVHPCPTYPKS